MSFRRRRFLALMDAVERGEVAAIYPQLAGECAGQKARRKAADAGSGLQVAAQAAQGHARMGTIAAIARSMVTVGCRIKTGAARQVKVCAGLVTVAVAG
jgi:hypothetical protein